MTIAEPASVAGIPLSDLPEKLGVAGDIARLKEFITVWVGTSSEELRQLLSWQLLARSKYFRPLTIFACHRAVSEEPVSERLLRSAVALELFHNVSLIIDDIVDRSRYRRGKLTLHCRFGELPALMVSGYLTAGGFALVSDNRYAVQLLAELMQRLGVAECFQWRVRRQALGVEDWRAIAGEDTGSMFEICARLGAGDDRLRGYGQLLGTLYHGCDDVGDVRGMAALGGTGQEDIRDGILTLPAALAIRAPETAVLFRRNSPAVAPELTRRMAAVIPEAEEYLNRLADEVCLEATQNSENSGLLLDLVAYTRALSTS